MKYHIKTFGCQMNKYDSDVMRGLLEKSGFVETLVYKEADIIILDTCSVRENAEHKVFTLLGELNKLKKRKVKVNQKNQTNIRLIPKTDTGKNKIIILAGCMVNLHKEELKKLFPEVDVFIGTDSTTNIMQKLNEFNEKRKKNKVEIAAPYRARNDSVGDKIAKLSGEQHEINAEHRKQDDFDNIPLIVSGENTVSNEENNTLYKKRKGISSEVVIMKGCDNFCSYCVVPYARGRETSRTINEILNEVNEDLANGIKEITLLGQNVNSYSANGKDFTDLLTELEKIKELKRIWFFTNHPKDFSEKLIDKIKNSEKICKYIHIPFQSGSDRILELMNRKYTRADYLRLIEKIKSNIPGIVISADIIVGFPTEKYEDFKETLDIVEKAEFIKCYCFKYSPREKTAAAKLEDNVPLAEKEERLKILNKKIEQSNKKVRNSFIDKEFNVLIESSDEFSSLGKAINGVYIKIETPNLLIGNIYKIKILRNETRQLIGILL